LKKSEDEATRADLSAGISAAERALQKANEAVDRDLLDEALEDLIGRVDDWKNHRVDQFGKLLLHGVYTVVTGKTDQEKDVGGPVRIHLPRRIWQVLIYVFLLTYMSFSMRSICSSAYCYVARKLRPTRARIRRTRQNRRGLRPAAKVPSFSSRDGSS